MELATEMFSMEPAGAGVQVEDETLAEKIARLVIRSTPENAIQQIYGLTQLELQSITESDEYKLALQKAADELHVAPIEIDTTWDAIERKSLKQLHTTLDVGFNSPDDLLRIASAANRAQRRGERNKEEDASSGGGNTIKVEWNQQFVSVIGNLNSNQRSDEVAKKASDLKMVDFMQPNDFEKLANSMTGGLLKNAATSELLDEIDATPLSLDE